MIPTLALVFAACPPVLAAPAPAATPLEPRARALTDFPAKVALLSQPLVDAEVVHGLVVGWIDADGTRATRGFGRRSRDDARTPDADSLFEIGSVTKVLTGLLLARAVERGELALEDDFNSILPADYKLPATVPSVRLIDVATHSAGMPEIPYNLTRDPALFIVDYSKYDERHLRAFTDAFAPSPPARAVYVYSNTGFGLLGWALARHAGKPFEQLLEDDITVPLGMSSTTVALSAANSERLVPGHDPNGDPVGRTDFGCLVACGGVVSTANDLLLLLSAYLDETCPLAGAMELTHRSYYQAPTRVSVGLGWHIAVDRVTRFHDGQTGGYTAFVSFDPVRRTGVVVLGNTSTAAVAGLGLAVVRELAGVDTQVPVLRVPEKVDPDRLELLVGTYESPLGLGMQVTRRDDRLYARIQGQPAWRLLPGSETEFFYRDIKATVTFERAEGAAADARPLRLVLHQNGNDHRCERVVD
jgi:CubicO group peptidase (beta-lactamase class C family)